MKSIIDVYNDGQDKYQVLIWSQNYIVIWDMTIKVKNVKRDWLIGKYEWMGNPEYKHCIMEITRLPGTRTGKGKFEGESPEAFEERVFQDIVSRPSHYFIGFDREKRTFGVKFWRKEFDLDKLKRTYINIEREVKETILNDSWYENYNACHVPSQCFYYPICSTGVVSDEIYEMKDKGNK